MFRTLEASQNSKLKTENGSACDKVGNHWGGLSSQCSVEQSLQNVGQMRMFELFGLLRVFFFSFYTSLSNKTDAAVESSSKA